MVPRPTCYYCGATTDPVTGRCRACGSLPPRGRRHGLVISVGLQTTLALLLAGSSLAYLALGTFEQQMRARGALLGCAVVALVGVGLMLVWPWPRGGLVEARWQGLARRRFGGARGEQR